MIYPKSGRARAAQALGVCAAFLAAVATASAGSGEEFDGCGELVQGVECVLFQADDDGLYILDEYGGFDVGRGVLVRGTLDPFCFSFCLQGDGCIRDNTIGSCGALIVSSNPADGAIDARQPTELDGTNAYGWSAVVLDFNVDVTGMTPDDFTISLDPPGIPPFLAFVYTSGQTAILQFGDFPPDPIPPGHWTVITHNQSGSTVRLGFLPGDVTGDGVSAVLDILALIDVLNGVTDRPIWSTDADRSGLTGPSDILRLIDLLNGANAFEAWNGRTLP